MLLQQIRTRNILPRGNYGGRPNKPSQKAMVPLVLWIKNQWVKGEVLGALFYNLNLAFLLVHKPQLLATLARKRWQLWYSEFHSQILKHLQNQAHFQWTRVWIFGAKTWDSSKISSPAPSISDVQHHLPRDIWRKQTTLKLLDSLMK